MNRSKARVLGTLALLLIAATHVTACDHDTVAPDALSKVYSQVLTDFEARDYQSKATNGLFIEYLPSDEALNAFWICVKENMTRDGITDPRTLLERARFDGVNSARPRPQQETFMPSGRTVRDFQHYITLFKGIKGDFYDRAHITIDTLSLLDAPAAARKPLRAIVSITKVHCRVPRTLAKGLYPFEAGRRVNEASDSGE